MSFAGSNRKPLKPGIGDAINVVQIYGPCQAKTCFQTCTKCADSDHSAKYDHPGLLSSQFIHPVVSDSESPDQTVYAYARRHVGVTYMSVLNSVSSQYYSWKHSLHDLL